LKPTKEELRELAAKQDAAEAAAKRHADTLRNRLSDAVKGVKANLKDAEDQLQSFSDATKDSISSTVALSDAIKTQDDAAKGVADALQARKDAYQDVADATKGVTDAEKKLADTVKWNDTEGDISAQEDLADAKLKLKDANEALALSEAAVTTAQDVQKESNYSKVFQKQIADAKDFASKLQWLITNQGLGQAGLQQLLNLGPEVGNIVAGEMIDGVNGFTSGTLNEALGGLQTAGMNLGNVAGSAFFGGNVAAGQTALGNVKNYQITVNAGLVSNPQKVGQDIIEAILAAERLSGQVFASV
jgi:hypothetical protein